MGRIWKHRRVVESVEHALQSQPSANAHGWEPAPTQPERLPLPCS